MHGPDVTIGDAERIAIDTIKAWKGRPGSLRLAEHKKAIPAPPRPRRTAKRVEPEGFKDKPPQVIYLSTAHFSAREAIMPDDSA